MALIDIRKKFVQLSGRYDLVTDTSAWTDNGANFYIQAGQDMLERMLGTYPESEGRIWQTLAASEYYLSFEKRCRSITSVWANNNESRTRLEKVSWDALKEYYADLVSETSTGTPLYYCPAKLRQIEPNISTTPTGINDAIDQGATGVFLNYTLANSKDFRGILIFPPVDEAYDMEVLGNFYQPVLTLDADTNFWTILHPTVLVKAAVYQVELFYRESKVITNLLASIKEEVMQIEMDVVEEDATDINHLEG